MEKQLIQYLSGFITTQRYELFQRVLNQRTSYLTVVLEDIFQPQNASAVLRTCECMGLQHVHIIENRNKFTVDKEVVMGSVKWLNLQKYNQGSTNSLDAVKKLKQQGYRIIATTPHKNDGLLPDFDLSKGKAALVFGSELLGISETILNEADEHLKIPIAGFTESFNISVSAAIVLFHLIQKLNEQNEIHWKLTEQEKDEIMLQWLRNSIKSSKLLEKQFLEERKQQL